MQVSADEKDTSRLDRVYAIGDVAETSAPKMARAGLMQAEVAWENILAQIAGKTQLKNYVTLIGMEGILKLSLGKVRILL
jgi:NADH dehydrogenase FAD-containing subunit